MQQKKLSYFVLMILGLVAAALLAAALHEGIVIRADSVRYFMGAENLAAGNGYIRFAGDGTTRNIVGFPPGYSILLTPLIAFGLDKLEAAAVLGIFFYSANTILIGWLVYRYSRKTWLAVLSSLAFLSDIHVLAYHASAMSEPSFIFFSLLGLVFMLEFLDKRKWGLLVLTGLVIGYVPLIRYNGLNLIPIAFLTILIFSKEKWGQRIWQAVVVSALSMMPTVIWFARNARVEGTATNRTLTYHPIPLPKVAEYVDQALSWFIPSVFQSSWRPRLSHLGLVLIIVTLLFLAYEFRRHRAVAGQTTEKWAYQILPLISLVFLYSYLLIIFLSTSFLDASMAAYVRYMVPVYVFLVIFIACMLHEVSKWGRWGRILSGAGVALWIFVMGFHFQSTINSLYTLHDNNHLSQVARSDEEAGEIIKSMDPNIVLYTDDIEMVYVLSDRYAFMIPVRVDNYTLEENEGFQNAVDAYHERMKQGAVLVVTNQLKWTNERYATYEELTEGMEMIHHGYALKMYRHPDYVSD